MIPKVQGYSAFKSYQEVPYPTLKVGIKTDPYKSIWADKQRKVDHINPNSNFNNTKSSYHKQYLENTKVEDYEGNMRHKKIIPKPNIDQVYNQNDLVPSQNPYMTSLQFSHRKKQNSLQPEQKLHNGTEHWQSMNRIDFKPPQHVSSALAKVGGQTAGISKVQTVNDKTVQNKNTQNISSDLKQDADLRWMRRQISMASRTGHTQYKFSYGMKIGHKPNPDILNQYSQKQPRIKNQLKMGTTQMTDHIPGYQGFIPTVQTVGKAFDQGKGQKTRTTFIKNNLYQNHQVFLPGYTGHKPSSVTNVPDKLRQKCFEAK